MRYAVIILSLWLVTAAYGQEFHGGLKAGLLMSQVDGDQCGGYHKFYPTGGVYVRNTFGKHWGMSLGLEYRHKGSKSKRDERVYECDLDYIEMPLLANYKITRLAIPRLFDYTLPRDLYLDFGLSGGYLVRGTEEKDGGGRVDGNYKRFELAMHAGLRFCFAKHWLVGWRFSYTFPYTPIRPHPGGYTYRLNRGRYNNNMTIAIIFEI